METARPTRPRRSLASLWRGLSAPYRRRIVLGSLVALSLGARDMLLFAAAACLFALSELGGQRVSKPAPG